MRRSSSTVLSIGAFALVSASLLTGAGAAQASRPLNANISPALAVLAARSGADDELKVIVQGEDALTATAVRGRISRQLGFGAVAATVRAGELGSLASQPGVSLVARDGPVAFTNSRVSAELLATTYPTRDSAALPWDNEMTGQGIGIAVIDSGVTPSSDFGSRLVQVRLDGQVGSLDDIVGHGTLVAGVAAGYSSSQRFIGIAPAATVYALNINRPTGVRTSDVIVALKWVFDNARTYNIRVVNLSLTETVKSSYTQSALDLALERLWARGVFVSVAAGNLGPGEIDYAPANDPLVFTTGAFDTMDTSSAADDTLATWSSSGTTVDGFAKPDLVAPGRHIAAPLPSGTTLGLQAPTANRVATGYTSINGTSFAAPQVAGAAAIIFQQHPGWSPDNVKWALVAKQGVKPKNSTIGSLSVSSAYNASGTPGRANQGVPALVCAPGATCMTGTTVASRWDSSSWASSSWASSSWAGASWNSSSWASTADWSSSSWASSSWASSSWASTSWSADIAGFDLWR